MIAFLLLAPLAGLAPAQAPTSVASTIVEVTVYPGSAAVRRSADLPRGSGQFLITGLPRALDPAALRVRAEGAEVVRVDLRQRLRALAPEARVETLRAELAGLERELAALSDERQVQRRVEEHLARLAAPEAAAGEAQPSLAVWKEDAAELARRMAAARARDRELERAGRALLVRRDALVRELGAAGQGDGVPVYDLLVDVFGPETPARLELDYLVPSAGWAPAYDLRATRDLKEAELVYRARVSQATGEDWRDVALFLSTAEPRRGAQGPDPEPRWVGVNDPRPSRPRSAPAGEARRVEEEKDKDASSVVGGAPRTSVLDEGLSVRYRLPSPETVESRAEPTTVLIGRAALKIAPERISVPALDPTVWLSAKARNTSEFVLLPGRAAVYFGADFVGFADLPAVQRGEELTLPLGPDAGLQVERLQLADKNEEAGTFGSRRTLHATWRIVLKNRGALSTRPDGAVQVIVHESLPKASDDRIEVELERPKPAPANEERWKKLREEKSVLTWTVSLLPGADATIEYATAISYPESLALSRRIER